MVSVRTDGSWVAGKNWRRGSQGFWIRPRTTGIGSSREIGQELEAKAQRAV